MSTSASTFQSQQYAGYLGFFVQKTQVTSQQNAASQTYCFYCFPRSFVLLFPIVLHQLCLLHQVGADTCDIDLVQWFSHHQSPIAQWQSIPPSHRNVIGSTHLGSARNFFLYIQYACVTNEKHHCAVTSIGLPHIILDQTI